MSRGFRIGPQARQISEARKRAYECACLMPPLAHKRKPEYDVMESEVVDWLVEQPEVRERVFYEAKQSGFIEYDGETGCWRGIDYETNNDEW